ncbi:hypothetical protein EIP86_010314 [Pleurotus ostreatoroseus]|nr:hypothetical protein EIP86_010314 [Pleurotus ostreatoroseus]
MSISVDDLVASLSSNHIGQEARDLAALQSQLQTLFYPTMPATPTPHNRRGTHSNTPICRTPTSASFCWDRPELDRRRSNSVANSMGFARKEGEDSGEHVELMDEDERMVEDMLFPAPPAAPHATPSQAQYPCAPPASPTAQYTMRSRPASVSTAYAPAAYDLSPSTASMFATTDPFYLAQLQAAQTPSFFSQYGMPTQQSPFIKGHAFQGHALAQPLAGTPC